MKQVKIEKVINPNLDAKWQVVISENGKQIMCVYFWDYKNAEKWAAKAKADYS